MALQLYYLTPRSKVALSMCKFCLFVYMYTQLCVSAQIYKYMHNLSLSAPKQHLNCNFSNKNSIPLPRTSPQSFWCKDFLELEKIQRQFGQHSWENRNHSNVSWTPCEPLPRAPALALWESLAPTEICLGHGSVRTGCRKKRHWQGHGWPSTPLRSERSYLICSPSPAKSNTI